MDARWVKLTIFRAFDGVYLDIFAINVDKPRSIIRSFRTIFALGKSGKVELFINEPFSVRALNQTHISFILNKSNYRNRYIS